MQVVVQLAAVVVGGSVPNTVVEHEVHHNDVLGHVHRYLKKAFSVLRHLGWLDGHGILPSVVAAAHVHLRGPVERGVGGVVENFHGLSRLEHRGLRVQHVCHLAAHGGHGLLLRQRLALVAHVVLAETLHRLLLALLKLLIVQRLGPGSLGVRQPLRRALHPHVVVVAVVVVPHPPAVRAHKVHHHSRLGNHALGDDPVPWNLELGGWLRGGDGGGCHLLRLSPVVEADVHRHRLPVEAGVLAVVVDGHFLPGHQLLLAAEKSPVHGAGQAHQVLHLIRPLARRAVSLLPRRLLPLRQVLRLVRDSHLLQLLRF
mmetsp:Transcript_25526/g.48276  ORF Transcript_25526/g.48276 Transcript_25526/m.48276 type:complete len:314 (-) Transcript_25526:410-1351(-)